MFLYLRNQITSLCLWGFVNILAFWTRSFVMQEACRNINDVSICKNFRDCCGTTANGSYFCSRKADWIHNKCKFTVCWGRHYLERKSNTPRNQVWLLWHIKVHWKHIDVTYSLSKIIEDQSFILWWVPIIPQWLAGELTFVS